MSTRFSCAVTTTAHPKETKVDFQKYQTETDQLLGGPNHYSTIAIKAVQWHKHRIYTWHRATLQDTHSVTSYLLIIFSRVSHTANACCQLQQLSDKAGCNLGLKTVTLQLFLVINLQNVALYQFIFLFRTHTTWV